MFKGVKKVNVELNTILEVYDEKINELQKENLILKAQLTQININNSKAVEEKKEA